MDHRERPRIRGLGWLVLFVLITGLFALFVFMPDVPRKLMGISEPPTTLGEEPRVTRSTSGETARRSTTIDVPSKVEVAKTKDPTTPITTTSTKPDPIASTPGSLQPQTVAEAEVNALKLLQQAETAHKGFRFETAIRDATKVSGMPVSDNLRNLAQDQIRRSRSLSELFSKLSTKDDLIRNVVTDHRLVVITANGQDVQALPVTSVSEPQPPEVEDGAAWVKLQLQAGRDLAVILVGRDGGSGGAGSYANAQITNVRPADHDAIKAKVRSTFLKRLEEIESGGLKNDPLAVYEAARYAYRNRLDQEVATLLDRALVLEPRLASTIREDKAREIFAKLVQSIQVDKNRPAAAGHMTQIEKHYKDTLIHPQARAFFDNDLNGLRMARLKATEAQVAQRQAALKELKAQAAQVAQDKDKSSQLADMVAAVEKEVADTQSEGEEPPQAEPPATGDRAIADKAMSDGTTLLAKAQAMPVCRARDQVYKEAEKFFTKARDLYIKLKMEAESTQANQYRYACIKMRRSF